MVVATGVDLETGIVYTNNPWGISGEQTFDEFMNGYVGLGSGKDSKLSHCLFPKNRGLEELI